MEFILPKNAFYIFIYPQDESYTIKKDFVSRMKKKECWNLKHRSSKRKKPNTISVHVNWVLLPLWFNCCLAFFLCFFSVLCLDIFLCLAHLTTIMNWGWWHVWEVYGGYNENFRRNLRAILTFWRSFTCNELHLGRLEATWYLIGYLSSQDLVLQVILCGL